MSNRLEIGRAIAELAVPQIGVEDAKVQARLVQYGKQFENYLDLSQLGRQLKRPELRKDAISAAKTIRDGLNGLNYWRRVFEVAGLLSTVTRIEVLIASDFIKHDLMVTSK